MQGNEDNIADEKEAPEAVQVLNDNRIPVPLPENLISPPTDNLMQISATLYSGAPSDSTISLMLSLKGGQAVTLAGTGNTNTFMN
jgi:hypothetical protein